MKTITSIICLVAVAFTAHSQFVPNDPYFDPDISGSVTQPGYYGQWHLRNQMPVGPLNAGLDANVWGAWQRGLTGNGVIISIIDDGTQGNHPDLVANFQNAFSWDYSMTVAANNAEAFRGMPQAGNDSHGTAVAGVAAAIGGNGIGLTGAAPGASVAAQRYLVSSFAGGVSENQAEAWAIGFQGQKNGNDEFDPSVAFTGSVAPVRVMNHSYGPEAGYGLGADWELIHPALAASAEKKVIHVYSAGNQRDEWTTQDSNSIFSNTSPNVIVVAALGSNGQFASYSSFGANVLVTAPSDSRTPGGQFSIATLDRTGTDGYNDFEDGPDAYFAPAGTGDLLNYTSTFGGTSSAAPLVSGIMALGVEANNNMDVRMARHLLAQTSRKVDASDPGWITNAAGHHFNQAYGFGLIDADAFTFKATQVESMTALTVYTEAEQTLSGQSFGDGQLTLTQIHNVNHTSPLPLEYVQVKITLSGLQTNLTDYGNGIGAILGDISGTLLSPSGTNYQLFSNDRNLIGSHDPNRTVEASLDWTFVSYAYFGEQINGNWTISLHNGSSNTNYTNFGSWESYQLIFGTGSIAMIPEPSSAMLLVIGGGIMLAMRRLRSGKK
jgi:subtilisin family serine protease